MVLSMERWVGQVAVVTGASSGIGAAVARKLTLEGLKVVGLARRSERIEEAAKNLQNAKGKLYAFQTDLTKEDDIKKAFNWITKNVGPVSILINNAGVHIRTSLLDEDTDNLRKMLDVNVTALCIATREAVKSMKENNIDGHIVHMNSISGHYICNQPGMSLYPATKYAVTAMTEVLRQEFVAMKSRIKISSISPGAVDTEIFDDVRHTKHFKEQIGNRMLQSEDIADGVVYVLSTPPHVQVHELTIKPVGQEY